MRGTTISGRNDNAMPFDYDRLIDWPFDTITQEYDAWDTIRYALSMSRPRWRWGS
jgi:hypothetical protein